MSYVKKGSTTEFITAIYKTLIQDEELMRLLYYLPNGYDDNGNYNEDPLNDILPNLVDNSDKYWEIVDERIRLGEKTSDLETKAICRIYISEGRRRSVYNNYHVATQEIAISIFVHESYDKDLRISRITDRLNELLALERLAGFGKIEYERGNPYQAPTHYRNYVNFYLLTVKKK